MTIKNCEPVPADVLDRRKLIVVRAPSIYSFAGFIEIRRETSAFEAAGNNKPYNNYTSVVIEKPSSCFLRVPSSFTILSYLPFGSLSPVDLVVW